MKISCMIGTVADDHARLGSINFERPLRGKQFEKLSDYNVPFTAGRSREFVARNLPVVDGNLVDTADLHAVSVVWLLYCSQQTVKLIKIFEIKCLLNHMCYGHF